MKNEKIKKLLKEPIYNMCQAFADDFCKTNADQRQKIGMKSQIIRNVMGNCCEWCKQRAGSHDYSSSDNTFFQRHDNCKCTIAIKSIKNGYRDWQNTQNLKIKRNERIAALEWTNRQNRKLGTSTNKEFPETIRKEIGKIDLNKLEIAKEYFKEKIKNLTVENAIVIQDDGGTIQFIGNANSCGIWGVKIEGATIIHNHPKSEGIVSFGSDDFDFLKANQELQEMIAVNAEYTYSVKILKNINEIDYNEIYKVCRNDDVRSYKEIDLQHDVFEFLMKKGYVEYV